MKVEMRNISKSFGANDVLTGVHLDIEPGEVHSLIGENGAGKSTLMNILTGLIDRDGGQIFIDGREMYYKNPLDAEHHGISFIHQELNNFQEMTVVENMFLEREMKNKFGLLNMSKMRETAKEYSSQLDANIDVDARLGSLSVGHQQMIEIAKSLITDAQLIIMDEPTAALTEKEIDRLFEVIRKLKSEDVSFIYISHRMEEIFEISDRVTVMRDDVSVNTYKTSDVDAYQIVKDMVGREIGDFYPQRHSKIGKVIFKAEGANQAIAAARSGAYTAFIGKVGDDENGKWMIDVLKKDGIDISQVAVSNQTSTGEACILLDDKGQNSIIVYGGTNQEISVDDIDRAQFNIASSDFLVTQFETPERSAVKAFRYAKKNDVRTILNPAPAKSHIDPELLKLTDLIIPNETESEIITGIKITDEESMKRSAEKIMKQGVKAVIITLGASGSYFYCPDEQGLINACRVHAIDTTAAGDTFIGALSSQLNKDFSNLAETIAFASKASSLTVQKLGAIPSIPTLKAIHGA
ncbi:ribokinase [Sporolactobacillus sp. THM7-4]|nr:ribokinase [Sporolactobacillus sp. THM7-4]